MSTGDDTAPPAGDAEPQPGTEDEQPTTWDGLAAEFEDLDRSCRERSDQTVRENAPVPVIAPLYDLGRAEAYATAAARIRYLLPRIAAAAPADDTAAPDVSEPDRWHVEDDARVPHWDLPIGAYQGVTAWNEGIEIDGELAEGGEVDAFEVVAQKLLAAISWHRRLAAVQPPADTEPGETTP